uniref:Trichohyalin-plectin-homology domain-containing protein n=1 Tax=Physcomitrium patens TaxID=3218 RepID=A0A7I4A9K8_PHYPA
MAKYSRPMRMPSNEDRIYKMRMYENKIADNIQAVKSYNQLMRAAEFGEQHIKKREEREIESREEAIRQCREQNLEIRRAKLSALLEGEDQLLNDELKTNSMTLAERRAWLEARSRALKQKQNTEACQRDRYAQEMMDKAWRDNADDVRVQDSKLAVLRAVEGRKRQLEEAVARKIIEEEENRKLEGIMERELKIKEQALWAEVATKAAKRVEATDVLNEQMELLSKLRSEEQAAVKAEMAAMNMRWQQEEEALKRTQAERKCYLDARNKSIQATNQGLRCTRNGENDADKRFEAECAALTAAREAQEILQEKELKDAQKREAKQYANHLKAVAARLSADDSFRNAQFKAEEDAESAKREAGWKREEDQRQRLWNRVHEERQNQLREKDKVRFEIEAQKRLDLENNERMVKMAAAEKERQLAEQRRVDPETIFTSPPA